ncbi:hypothetical protein EC957_010137 [Mortierella hygrophila]|uniref:F-box domain-containing protein n=1 Tax=Mortierella hygrophila TaxID=979708 RepID=A0A9P6K4N6_9FUNG|nr:hypothetical protein EC957_010137 [Mortierella hygrophila]
MIYNNQETPVAYFPEILIIIGSHLDRHDVLSCIQVCRFWNQVFTPFVWRIFDDEHFSKLAIHTDESAIQSPREVLKAWLRDVFSKHGQHIRHLTIHHDSTAKAAVTAGSCTRLTSLNIIDVPKMVIPGDRAEVLTRYQHSEEYSKHMLSPSLEDFMPSVGELCRKGCIKVWMTTLRCWHLILSNPSLDSLHLGRHAWICYHPIQEQFIYDTFASLTNLTQLRNDFRILKLQTLLEVLPNLHHYTCALCPYGVRRTKSENLLLSRTFPQLEILELPYDRATPATIYNLLEFLPNLEELSLDQVCRSSDERFSSEDAVAGALARIGDRPIQLKELTLWHLVGHAKDCNEMMERYVKPFLPHTTFPEWIEPEWSE